MTELFIYYRARVDRASALRVEALAMQARLRREHPGLNARLLCRPESVDGLHTWMETYATDPMQRGVDVVAAARRSIDAEAAGLVSLIEGPRHMEVFVACAC